jgi:hypothetical protein
MDNEVEEDNAVEAVGTAFMIGQMILSDWIKNRINKNKRRVKTTRQILKNIIQNSW